MDELLNKLSDFKSQVEILVGEMEIQTKKDETIETKKEQIEEARTSVEQERLYNDIISQQIDLFRERLKLRNEHDDLEIMLVERDLSKKKRLQDLHIKYSRESSLYLYQNDRNNSQFYSDAPKIPRLNIDSQKPGLNVTEEPPASRSIPQPRNIPPPPPPPPNKNQTESFIPHNSNTPCIIPTNPAGLCVPWEPKKDLNTELKNALNDRRAVIESDD